MECLRRYAVLALAFSALGCGDSGLPWDPGAQDKDPFVDPCNPLPANDAPERATLMRLDEEVVGTYCKAGGPPRLWFRVEGQFEDMERVRLQVRFGRGAEAEDLDFRVGILDGENVRSTLVAGSCSNAAGLSEECIVELDTAQPATELYVRGTAGTLAESELFYVKVTRAPAPVMP